MNVSKDTTNGELSDRIAREIENRGEQNIYRFRLKGMRILTLSSTWNSFPHASG